MSPALAVFFVVAVALRLASVAVSRRNERRLLAAGAVEHGAGVSNVLVFLHSLVYVGCALEGTLRETTVDLLSVAGMGLYALAMAALVVVVAQLGELWTMRLLLAPDHALRETWLFRTLRHPNYLLNILPELVGLVLAFHAWIVTIALLPAYGVALRARVAEEERVMGERFPRYGGDGSP